VDIWEAIALANRHPRVRSLTRPGVGGHCISVDPWFWWRLRRKTLIDFKCAGSERQPACLSRDFIQRKTGSLRGKRVAALGLAYKADVDDLRESPAITAVELLRDAGAQVTTCEPFKAEFKIDGAKSAPTLEEAVKDADILLLLVGHTQFKQLDPLEVRKITPAKTVIDAVNNWPRETWLAAGFDYFHLGDGKH
jgi:UDP-N-acetyl-D-mannosaminuronic acid dehydrogenase